MKLFRCLMLLTLLGTMLLALGGRPGQAHADAAPSGLDPTFGDNGILRLHVGTAATNLAMQADGKILVAGSTRDRDTHRLNATVVRLNSDGSYDESFGSGGKFTTTRVWASSDNPARSIALLLRRDGKIVLGGANGGFALVQLLPNGQLDASFGNIGLAEVNPASHGVSGASSLAEQADGKIVVGGAASGDATDFALARFTAAGSVDTTFGISGTVTTGFDLTKFGTSDEAYITKVFVLGDGRILAVGGSSFYNGYDDTLVSLLVRYTPDGVLDENFGDGGIMQTSSPNASGAAIDAQERIVVAGVLGRGQMYQHGQVYFEGMRRFASNGGTDNSFGMADPNTSDGGYVTVGGFGVVTVAPDGKIVTAGGDGAVRYYQNGKLDTAFGRGGAQASGALLANAVAVQTDGKVIIAGGDSSGIVVARFNASSTCASSFSDVAPGDYFAPAVADLSCRTAVSGYDDGTFRPFSDVTRSQFVKMVLVALQQNLYHEDRAMFLDTQFDDIYVNTAYMLGIVTGYPSRRGPSFHPNIAITRGQLCKILVVAFGWNAEEPATPHFSDVGRTNPFYKYIEAAYAHGAISGYADGTFRWQANTTRGQATTIISRALQAAQQPGTGQLVSK